MEVEEIISHINECLIKDSKKPRNIILRTGVSGMELFEEVIEERLGFKRVYIGKKVLRILRVVHKDIRKNRIGKYYKLVKNGQ